MSNFLPSLPSLPPSFSSSPDPHPFRCHDDDPDKPKGKRPCKTKHTGGEAAKAEGQDEGGSDEEERNGKVRFFLFIKCDLFIIYLERMDF